ncbi:MAG: glycosyltransferase [Oculatellaceae cyanobacterium Prado106]|jgi:hypothetical protein|nr:glycosyltransferase [Oculatellaceae cyanobacterium Prado106]
MRKLYFLLPGTGQKFACGGLWAELKTFHLAQKICSAEVVTYRQREPDTLFLNDLLGDRTAASDLASAIFVMSWGFDVAKLAAQLRPYNAIYHAHSAGYGFTLPASVPIITVSRSTMGYWGQQAPNSLIYYLPNQISDEFQNYHQPRPIDVLVQARKSSEYLLQHLVPALRSHCNVTVIDRYVEDLPALFNQAKVYLYDSAEYWAQQKVTEGFGLQPLEAIACGCQVFSSINGGLSDYLDPGFNCAKIAGYSREFDVQRILQVVQHFPTLDIDREALLAEYRLDSIVHRLQVILTDLNQFFDHKPQYSSNIPVLTPTRRTQLWLQKVTQKIRKKLG